jgi:hypothetical protein
MSEFASQDEVPGSEVGAQQRIPDLRILGSKAGNQREFAQSRPGMKPANLGLMRVLSFACVLLFGADSAVVRLEPRG